MKSFFLTDTGRVRDHNEDSVTILKNANNEYLLAVADGMGGHKAGEVASSMAINHITSKFNSLESLGSKEKAINWIREEVAEINNSIFSYTALHEESKGMGTTFVIALYTKDYLLFGNVGDSSGFVIKNSKLYTVTKDHTLVNLLVASGELTEEEAQNHPKKNMITKALGCMGDVVPNIYVENFEEKDIILMTSDGLTNMVKEDEILKIINENPEEAVDKLIKKANDNGGYDNITVVIIL